MVNKPFHNRVNAPALLAMIIGLAIGFALSFVIDDPVLRAKLMGWSKKWNEPDEQQSDRPQVS